MDTEPTQELEIPADLLVVGRHPEHRAGWRPGRILQAAGALLLFGATSVLLFGLPALRDPTRAYVGLAGQRYGPGATDPQVYMWSLVWWPYAITHHLNPLLQRMAWAPAGSNLAWATSVPGAALLAWPLTARFGPVAAYNALMLAAPTLAAWTAYLLCRHLTGRFGPSLVGGYLFGFSSYELAQMTSHLNLSLVFPIPVAVLLVLLRVEGRLRPVAFVPALAGVLVLQFSFSAENFATMVIFGLVALALGLLIDRRRRRALLRAGMWTGAGIGLAVLLLSPYLWFALKGPAITGNLSWQRRYSIDLLNLVVPTPIARFGGEALRPVSSRFTGNLGEDGGYLGVLVVPILAFAIERRRTASGRILLWALGTVIVASLGPTLHVDGVPTIPLPWAPMQLVPVVRDALPARYMVYAWLAVSLIIALWLSGPPRPEPAGATEPRGGAVRPPLWRWAMAGTAVMLLLPNTSQPLWSAIARVPPFFTGSSATDTLHQGTTLVIPFGSKGWSELWQAESGMSFRLAGGYLGCQIPPSYQRYAIVHTLRTGRLIPDYGTQLKAFLAGEDVRAIVVQAGVSGPWHRLFATLRVAPVKTLGVELYRIPLRLLREWRRLHPHNPFRSRLAHSCA